MKNVIETHQDWLYGLKQHLGLIPADDCCVTYNPGVNLALNSL